MVEVAPDREHPMGGPFCIKAAAAPEFIYDPVRLKHPMKRTNSKSDRDAGWTRVSWEEALETIAEKLLKIRSKERAEAVAFYRPAPGGSPSLDYHHWLMRFAHAFGSPNIVQTTHICNWHKDSGSKYTYGVGIPEPDYENSRCIIIWGMNPHATAVRHAMDVEKSINRGAKVIVIDPRKIPLTNKSTMHLHIMPGSDLALALGLLNHIIRKGLYDTEFVTRWTNASFLVRDDTGRLLTEEHLTVGGSGDKYVCWNAESTKLSIYDPKKVSFEPSSKPTIDAEVTVKLRDGREVDCSSVFTKLKKTVSTFSLQQTSKATSIPEDDIAKAADLMTSSRPLSYYSYNGIEQHADAMQTNRAICILYALIGDLDRKGGNVTYPDVPLNSIAGFNLIAPAALKNRLGGLKRPLGPAGVEFQGEGAAQAYDVYEAIMTRKPYPIRALVSFGGNMIVSNGDSKRGMEALRNLDFYVHMDLYENPTSRFADILLPAASAWESEFVGKHEWRDRGHMQLRRKIVEPEYERRGDLEVIFELAIRMGLGSVFFGGNIEHAFNFMLSPLGKTVAEIRDLPNGISVPLTPKYQKYQDIDPESGYPRGMQTRSRLVEIYSRTFADHGYDPLPTYSEPPERNVNRTKYPLLLTTFKPRHFIHGSYRSIPSLRKGFSQPTLEIHPVEADRAEIIDGDWVLVETSKGAVKAKAKITYGIHSETVAAQEGWWQACEQLGLPGYEPFSEHGSNVNLIIGNELIDPITGSVAHRGVPCRVRKF